MRKVTMEPSWRTAQIFISAQAAGVFEVEIDQSTSSIRCNCPVWKSRQSCKHTRFVGDRLKANRGRYAIVVPENIPEEEIVNVGDDPNKFRAFILKYGKVEVL